MREFSSPYLSDPGRDPIVIICTRCNRRGRYSRASLLEKYGDVAMPSLPMKVAADRGCYIAKLNSLNSRERCAAAYEL